LSLGELLDRTFTLYRTHFLLFIGIMALPQLFGVAMNLLLQAAMGPLVFFPPATRPPANNPTLARAAGGVLLGIWLVLLLNCVVYAVALGATTFAVSDVYLGRRATIRAAYQHVRGRIGRLLALLGVILLVVFTAYMLAAVLAVMVSVLLGMLYKPLAVVTAVLGILGGVLLAFWLALRYGVAVPALLLEKNRVIQAMKRSAALTKGHLGRVFLIVLMMAVITYAVIAIFQGPFLIAFAIMAKGGFVPLWLRSLSVISAVAGGTLTGPLLMIALALLYYDVRVRKEAFDLQMMMAALDSSALPATIPPAVTQA
jgi:membrane-anchored glycerophosphoryl diester phosphodiesterase (GDPDase)